MKIVCAWCNKNMGEKNGRGVKGVTHGLCKQCFAKFMAKAESDITAGASSSLGTQVKNSKR